MARVFLKLGILGFGGPAAHIAMMEEEVVKKRSWIPQQGFLDLLSASNLIPGPTSTEMTLHVGWLRGRWVGMLVAGAAFILPAVFISGVFAWAYVRWGRLPAAEPFLAGVKPAVVAVIAFAGLRLGRSAMAGPVQIAIALAVAAATLGGIAEPVALLGGASVGLLLSVFRKSGGSSAAIAATLSLTTKISWGAVAVTSGKLATGVGLWRLAGFFLMVGSVLYGSGYVLIAFLEGWLVQETHLLTREQLLDAVAIGQFTPGPLSSTATVIGYMIAGIPGAVVATIAMFLPCFLFVIATHPFVFRLRKWKHAGAFLDAANAGSVALILVVALRFAMEISGRWESWVIAAAASAALYFRVNSAVVILAGALLGWGLSFT